MVLISNKSGILSNLYVPSARIVEANMGKLEFLEPLILTFPLTCLPGIITYFSRILSLDFHLSHNLYGHLFY